jgi:hypothetical protein
MDCTPKKQQQLTINHKPLTFAGGKDEAKNLSSGAGDKLGLILSQSFCWCSPDD